MWISFVAPLLLFLVAHAHGEQCACVTTTSGLNARAQPGASSTKIGAIPFGNCPRYTGEQKWSGSYLWYKLNWNGKVAWVASNWLKLEACKTGSATPPPSTRAPSANRGNGRELRGVWIATVANIDWPSRATLSTAAQKQEMTSFLDKLQQLHFNAIFFQVRPAGDALYRSDLEPWSQYLTGTQGKAPSPYYDPLEFIVKEAHARNIEVHAWFNPYRAKLQPTTAGLAPTSMARRFPSSTYRYGNYLWMDPGVKQVQDHTYNVIMDVTRRYDIDGIHFDDYFYPYKVSGTEFPDSATYAAYHQGGGALTLADWRRDNVNTLVQRLQKAIRSTKSWVKFTISPFGIWRPGNPPSIKGFDQYNGIYADPKLWLEQGWVDALIPQLYWRIDPPAQSYPVLLDWWVAHNPSHRHVYAGNYLSKVTSDWPVSEIQRQVGISRQRNTKLSLGNVMFSAKIIRDNTNNANAMFRSIYTSPALPPVMQWLKETPVATPIAVRKIGSKLTWQRPASGNVRSWAVWRLDSRGYKETLVTVLSRDVTSVTVGTGNYGVTGVSRLGRESALMKP